MRQMQLSLTDPAVDRSWVTAHPDRTKLGKSTDHTTIRPTHGELSRTSQASSLVSLLASKRFTPIAAGAPVVQGGEFCQGAGGKRNRTQVHRRTPAENAGGSAAEVGEDQGRITRSGQDSNQGGQTKAWHHGGGPQGAQHRYEEALGGEEGGSVEPTHQEAKCLSGLRELISWHRSIRNQIRRA
jgi:hypothetical protein